MAAVTILIIIVLFPMMKIMTGILIVMNTVFGEVYWVMDIVIAQTPTTKTMMEIVTAVKMIRNILCVKHTTMSGWLIPAIVPPQ